MAEYINKESGVSEGYLSDWYISSVGNELTMWTDEHISELLNDFIVIPKDTPAADVQPVKRGEWNIHDVVKVLCSGETLDGFCQCSACCDVFKIHYAEHNYCPNCGARMDGGADDENS